jgi:PIN domain nuclease of toxin-antitoxin system
VILLDTCALIWIVTGDVLAPSARSDLEAAWSKTEAAKISPISAWEVGLLTARGRLSLSMQPERWWEAAVRRDGFELAPMPPDVLIASCFLPGAPPNDPADRILAATARAYGLRIMTRDRKLLDYADQGHLQAIAC